MLLRCRLETATLSPATGCERPVRGTGSRAQSGWLIDVDFEWPGVRMRGVYRLFVWSQGNQSAINRQSIGNIAAISRQYRGNIAAISRQ